MSRRVVTIHVDEPVAHAAERLAEQDVGVLAVCGADRRLSAMITDRDIVVRALAQGLDPEEVTAGECGTSDPATVPPSATMEQAARRMEEQQVRRLPVVQQGRLVGIVSQSDLAANGAHQRTGKLLARMAQPRGDRRSARWLLRRPYRGSDQGRLPGRAGLSGAGGRFAVSGEPAAGALAPLIDSPPSIYLAGLALGIVLAVLALLRLGPFP
jgi:predicted transcriptional regulator